MQTHKLLTGCTAMIAVLLSTTACSRTTEERAREATQPPAAKVEMAHVRFIDAHTGNANLYFGDTQAFSGGGGKITDYKQLPAERRQFSLRPAAGGEELATNSEGLGEGKYYTVVAFEDEKGKASLRVVNDNESAPSQGKAKVRMIHASPEMEALNLYVVGRKEEIADQSRFSTGSTWQEVDPVKGTLELRSSDRKTGSVRIPGMTLEAGKLYTFVVTGGDDTKKKLKVTPIVDMPRA